MWDIGCAFNVKQQVRVGCRIPPTAQHFETRALPSAATVMMGETNEGLNADSWTICLCRRDGGNHQSECTSQSAAHDQLQWAGHEHVRYSFHGYRSVGRSV